MNRDGCKLLGLLCEIVSTGTFIACIFVSVLFRLFGIGTTFNFSLQKSKISLNPAAKEFKMNPDAKVFVPKSLVRILAE